MQTELDQAQRALELACGLIDKRERTVAEVAGALQRAGIDPPGAQAAIDELVALGYLDDIRFAKLFAQDKRTLEQWGKERIERGLIARGIDRELVAAALADSPQQSELERALATLARRFPQPPADRRERERALGFLLRKGYDNETALEALSVARRAGMTPAV